MTYFFSDDEDVMNNKNHNENIFNHYDFSDKYILNDNFNNSIDLDEKNFSEKKTYSNLYLNKVEDFKISPHEEKTTAFITKENKLLDNEVLMNKEEENKNLKPEYFSYDDIKTKIFEPIKSHLNFDCQEKLKKDEEIENYFLNKKRKKENNINVFFANENEDEDEYKNKKNGKKRGRPLSLDSENKVIHTRFSQDNIFKKIKSEIFKSPVEFINTLLNKTKEDEDKILKLNYKYINQIKKEKDIGYLNMPLKEFLSMDISSKYPKKQSNLNKENINKILDETKDNETIQFAFNMTFRDFINIFTKKIKVDKLMNNLDQNTKIETKRIENSIQGIEKLLNKISENNDSKYFSLFCIFLYNYELWLYNKHSKKPKTIKKIYIK